MAESPKAIEKKAGYLVLRLKSGEGFMIAEQVEIRLASVAKGKFDEAQIAVKAPKEISIRRLK